MRVTNEQIKLLEEFVVTLYEICNQCQEDMVFSDFINEVVPKYNLSNYCLNDLASQWEEAIKEAKVYNKRDYKLESLLYPFLYEIAEHNRNLIKDDDEPYDNTKGLFTFEHYDQIIADPFVDESLRDEVDPFKYYGPEKLKALVAKWITK